MHKPLPGGAAFQPGGIGERQQETALRTGQYPRSSLGWYACGVLTIGWALSYLDRMVIALLTPALKISLTLSDTQVGIVQGMAFSLFFAVAGLPLGRLVDHGNRRNIIMFGVLCWSVMTALCGMAQSYPQLLAARVGVGVGEACLAPASFSLLADYLRPDQRGRAIGIISSAGALGTAGSSLLGGLMLKEIGNRLTVHLPLFGEIERWRFVFLAFAVPGPLIAMLMLTVAEPDRVEMPTVRPPFLPFLRQHSSVFLPLYAACGLNGMIALGVAVWGPQVFIRNHHMSVGDVGVMVGTTVLVVGLCAGLSGGALSDALARRFPLDGRLRVSVLIAPLMALLVSLFAWRGTVWLHLLAFAGVIFSYHMTTAAAYAALQELAPNRLRGQMIAAQSLVVNIIGMGVGPTLIAIVTDRVFADEGAVRWSIVAVCLPAALFSFVLSWLAMRRAHELIPAGRAT